MYERAKKLERYHLDLSTPNITIEEKRQLDKHVVGQKSWFYDQEKGTIAIFSEALSIKTLR